MVISDSLGYSSLGFSAAPARNNFHAERNAVVLEAKLDPKKPNEYSVQTLDTAFVPPEKASETKGSGKRAPQNTDPVSRAFNTVAEYEARMHRIDIHV